MSTTLAIDVMGGDYGIKVTLPACIKFLKSRSDTKLILVGDKEQIYTILADELNSYKDQIEIVHTTQVVEMDDLPQTALRNKRDSSMRVAINLVRDKKAQAVISAGNTGALMATSRYVLRTMKTIDRPAIAKILPTIKGKVCVLDLGANIECSPEQLFQFGLMGSILMHAVTKNPSPKVGILNIGSEEIKGHEGIKKAAELLRNSSLNFYGNVEGDDINKGTVDVVVCDGFTGNVALKTLEGVAKMISFFIKKEFSYSLFTKLIALIGYPVISRLKKKMDPHKYNGAVLLGLTGLVIKSHGATDENGFYYAIEQAFQEVQAQVIPLMEEYLNAKSFTIDKDSNKKELTEFEYLNML